MKLLNRLSISRKLMALTLLVLIAISIPSAFQMSQARDLALAAQGELNGLAPARQLVKLAQLTQQHRGLAAATLGGKAQAQGPREAKAAEVKQQFDKLDAMLTADLMTDAMRGSWREARSQWEALSSQVTGKALTASESSTKHAQLIAVCFKLLDQLVDQSGLILDPEANTYFLISATLTKLPYATEALGQTRARGAGFLAEGKIGPEGRTLLAGLVQQATDQQASMVTGFGKSFAVDPEVKRRLGDKIASLNAQVEGSLQLTRQELIGKDELKLPPQDYIDSFTKTIDAIYACGEVAMDTLDEILKDRVHQLRVTMWTVAGLVLMMILGIYATSRSISRSITLPLEHAARLAEHIAQRDLCGEVENQRGDEIGQMMTALLAMRDSLRGVIVEVRGNADEVALASQELAVGNSDLSQRTEQQASALEQTASSMEELSSTVRSNADQAADASKLAQRAS